MDAVVEWLLDPADPGVRAQTLVDLSGRDEDDKDVVAARRASLTRGTVARVLDGLVVPEDPRALYVPKYKAGFHRLVALAEMGAPGNEPRIEAALEACLAAFHRPDGGFGRTQGHLCVTGNMVRAAWAFGRGDDERVEGAVAWLVRAQIDDGGWACWPMPDGKGTIDSWEALAAFAAMPAAKRSADVRRAIERGLAFLAARNFGLDDGYAPYDRIHFPRHYYYDALVGLDLATRLGMTDGPALRRAAAWLAAKRRSDGRWALDATHPDLAPDADYTPHHADYPVPVDPLVIEEPGAPSRWATLLARRALARLAPPREGPA